MRSSPSKLRQLVERVKDGRVVFLVGSGISSQPPACLPTAADLMQATAERYLPSEVAEVHRVLQSIQPEVFYEELTLFLGEDALRALGSLATEDSEPTISHYLLVRLAQRNSLPIVTTNFDCLFEQAARALGIDPVVSGPSGPFEVDEDGISIWKVHGSIEPENPESIGSLAATMSQITAPNPAFLEQLGSYASANDLCLLAYSGRDIDLFPYLRRAASRSDIFWLDTNPDNVAVRARLAEAILLSGTLTRAMEQYHPELIEGLEQVKPQQFTDRARLKTLLHDLVSGGPLLAEVDKQLLLALCLYRVGDAQSAVAKLKENEVEHLFNKNWLHRTRSRLELARLSDAISDYCSAERHSLRAVENARQQVRSDNSVESIAFLIHGIHSLSMARKMQLGPTFPFNVAGVKFRIKRGRAALVFLQYFRSSIRLWWLQRRLEQRLSGLDDERLEAWIRRARNRYYDHALILIALLDGVIGRMPLVRQFLHSWLSHIKRRAQGHGDWRVLPHVVKQMQRLIGVGRDDLGLADHAYQLAGDPLNRALLARNEGEELLKDGRRVEARERFSIALENAELCGSKATGIKALASLYACDGRVRWEDLRPLLEGLTGEGYERFGEAFALTVQVSDDDGGDRPS